MLRQHIDRLQIDLQIQRYPSQNSGRLLCKNQPADSEMYTEVQRPRWAKTISEKDKN